MGEAYSDLGMLIQIWAKFIHKWENLSRYGNFSAFPYFRQFRWLTLSGASASTNHETRNGQVLLDADVGVLPFASLSRNNYLVSLSVATCMSVEMPRERAWVQRHNPNPNPNPNPNTYNTPVGSNPNLLGYISFYAFTIHLSSNSNRTSR